MGPLGLYKSLCIIITMAREAVITRILHHLKFASVPYAIAFLCTPRLTLAKYRGHAYALPDISVHRCIGENP